MHSPPIFIFRCFSSLNSFSLCVEALLELSNSYTLLSGHLINFGMAYLIVVLAVVDGPTWRQPRAHRSHYIITSFNVTVSPVTMMVIGEWQVSMWTATSANDGDDDESLWICFFTISFYFILFFFCAKRATIEATDLWSVQFSLLRFDPHARRPVKPMTFWWNEPTKRWIIKMIIIKWLTEWLFDSVLTFICPNANWMFFSRNKLIWLIFMRMRMFFSFSRRFGEMVRCMRNGSTQKHAHHKLWPAEQRLWITIVKRKRRWAK